MPTVGRVLETALYVDSVERAMGFYERVFGFPRLECDGDRFSALGVGEQQVLLLFKKGATTKPVTIPGGMIPPHDGSGTTHLAFTMAAEDEPEWVTLLESNGVPIESRVKWPRGGFSLYFRDLDGHLLELVAPGCWATY